MQDQIEGLAEVKHNKKINLPLVDILSNIINHFNESGLCAMVSLKACWKRIEKIVSGNMIKQMIESDSLKNLEQDTEYGDGSEIRKRSKIVSFWEGKDVR